MDQLDLLDLPQENTPQVGDGDLVHERYPMDTLIARWRELEEFGEQRHVMISGVDDTLAACVIADLARRLERSVLLVCPSMDSARRLANDLELFSHEAPDEDILQVADAEEDALPQSEHEVAIFPRVRCRPLPPGITRSQDHHAAPGDPAQAR